MEQAYICKIWVIRDKKNFRIGAEKVEGRRGWIMSARLDIICSRWAMRFWNIITDAGQEKSI